MTALMTACADARTADRALNELTRELVADDHAKCDAAVAGAVAIIPTSVAEIEALAALVLDCGCDEHFEASLTSIREAARRLAKTSM